MKIYDREGTPNAARIRIVVAEKALEDQVQYVTVDLMAAGQKQPEFLSMNPVGKTPVLLLDDGTVLSESVAITEYLDNVDGKPTLTGQTALEKGLIHMMHRRAEMMVLDAVDDYFHYGTPGLGPALVPWRMPDWDGKLEWGRRRGSLAIENMTYFEDVLSQKPFLAGDRFSFADITLFAAVEFAAAIGLALPVNTPGISTWYARVRELPAVAHRSGQDIHPDDLARFAKR